MHDVPVGPLCEECYTVGVIVLRFPTGGDFIKAHSDNLDIREKTKTVRGNIEKPGSAADFTKQQVLQQTEFEVELEHIVRGYTDLSLRKILEVQRLTKAGMKDIPEVIVPCRHNPGEVERLYIFPRQKEYGDDDEGVDMKIRAKTRYLLGGQLLGFDENLHSQHGNDIFQAKSRECFKEDGFATVLSKKLLGLEEFISNYEGGRKRKFEVADATPGTAAKRLKGKAANEFEVAGPEQSTADPEEDDLNADLSERLRKSGSFITTPKRRDGSAAAAGEDSATIIDGEGEEDQDESDEEPSAGHPCPK